MNPWIIANVLAVKKWTNNLFSLILNASIEPFYAGQFNKLSVVYDTDSTNQNRIQRAYSYVNAPQDKNIEIYIVRVENGKMSNILYNLKSGDNIFIKKKSFGFFIINEIPDCKNLWMFATGTAIGPYCSILKSGKNLNRFNKIILIHAARYQSDLTYLPLMKELHKRYNGKLIIQTITSQEQNDNSLTGRIPILLKNNILEQKIGLTIEDHTSHVMLCGNPSMIKDTCLFLKNNRNMKKHLRRETGHITLENYW